MTVEMITLAGQTTDAASLPLVTDIQYLEPFTSTSLNRKFCGVVRSGVFRGFACVPAGGMTLNLVENKNQTGEPVRFGVALVERDDYLLTVRQQKTIAVTIPAGQRSYVILEAFFEHGVTTSQVDSDSEIEAASVKVLTEAQLQDHHVIICALDVPAGTTELLESHLDLDVREIGGYDLDAHLSQVHPHKQYVRNDANSEVNANLQINDNYSLAVGNSGDLQLKHTGGNSLIESKTGHLYLNQLSAGKDLLLQVKNSADNVVPAIKVVNGASPSVWLYYGSDTKLKTYGSGVSVIGNLSTSGEIFENGQRVFSPNNRNISNSVTSSSTTIYASIHGVKRAYDRAAQAEFNAITHADNLYNQLLGDAPQAALDTLTELAAQLNDDESAINAINTTLTTKADKATTVSVSGAITGGGTLGANFSIGVRTATTSQTGVVQLSNSVTSTSSAYAATAYAVKQAYDLAKTKLDANANAVSASKWNTARTLTIGNQSKTVDGTGNVSWSLADMGAVDKAGDTMTGDLIISKGINVDGALSILEANEAHGLMLKYDGTNNYAQLIMRENGVDAIKYYTSRQAGSHHYFTNAMFINANQDGTGGGSRVFADNYHPNADKWTTARTLTLSGDASGSVSLDGSANVSLAVTVADNSHNHTSLNGVSKLRFGPGGAATDDAAIEWLGASNSGYLRFSTSDDNGTEYMQFGDYDTTSQGGAFTQWLKMYRGQAQFTGNVSASTFTGALSGNASTASKWTTARTLTLSGDVSGSVSWDGSANATLNATVANDSHSHSQLSGSFVSRTASQVNHYGESVVLLAPMYDGTIISSTKLDGVLSLYRGGTASSNSIVSINLSFHSAYNVNRLGYFYTGNYGRATKIVSCYYNGVKYLALHIYGNAQDNSIYWRGLSTASDSVLLTVIDVIGDGTSGGASIIQNDEIYNSITEERPSMAVLSGNGNWSINDSGFNGNASTSSALQTARTIALTGDVTGSASFDGSANATITAVVADDSHNHVITNVDGLQAALDAKLASASYTAADVLAKLKTVDGSGSGLDADLLDGTQLAAITHSGDSVVLTGDVTGSTTVASDGSISITTTVANDSHTHDGRYYTEAEANARFVNATGDTISGNLAINGTITLADTYSSGEVRFPASQVINRRFEMVENASPQYILLCGNAVNNDVNGTVTMDRTSGNWQACWLQVIVSSGTTPTPRGSIIHHGVVQNNEEYTLVTVTYAGQSYVAIKYTGNAYPETTGAWFSGRLASTIGNSLTVVDAASITNEAALLLNSKYELNGQSVFHEGYHPNADKWTTARTLSLSGDASGSVSWDGSDNATLSVTVANDSHSHSNYLPLSGGTLSGNLTIASAGSVGITINADTDNVTESDLPFLTMTQDNGIGQLTVGVDNNKPYIYPNRTDNPTQSSDVNQLWLKYKNGTFQQFFHDGYHPNADKWTTARTLSLTGDVTGSASFDGSANATITATVADDSHNHVITNVDGLQTALDGKLSTSGKAADSNLLDGIDSSGFARYSASGGIGNALANAAWVTSNGGASNIDHIWHDDDANRWHFVSDGTFKRTGNASVQAATFVGALSGNASTATWADTVDVNSGNTSGSWYDIVWHSGDSLFSSAGVEIQGSTNSIKASRFYAAGTTYYLREATGDYGTVAAYGRKGGWSGYSIEGRAVFMHNGSTSVGLYNDVNNQWILKNTFGAETALYYGAGEKIRTTSTGVLITGVQDTTPIVTSNNVSTYDISGYGAGVYAIVWTRTGYTKMSTVVAWDGSNTVISGTQGYNLIPRITGLGIVECADSSAWRPQRITKIG